MSKIATRDQSPRNTVHPLRIARQRAGLSLSQVGERVGVSKATVSKWELDQMYPRPGQAAAILAMFPELSMAQIYAVKQAA